MINDQPYFYALQGSGDVPVTRTNTKTKTSKKHQHFGTKIMFEVTIDRSYKNLK